MARHLLSDVDVRKAKPGKGGHPKRLERSYRLFDGEGLALFVAVTGVKSWQLRYRLAGKEQTATLGKYPRVSLGEARAKADELRRLVDDGQHLTVHKRVQRAAKRAENAATFGKFSAAWVDREARRARWSPEYKDEVAASLTNHLAELDGLPMTKVTAPVVAPHLHAVERAAPHMLEKVRRRLRAILDDAVEQGVLQGNPLPAVRRSRKGERRHFPAVTDLQGVGEILRKARASDPCKGVQRAHQLLAFTAQRVGEIVPAKWTEFDLEHGTWSIPRVRMKRKDAQRGPHTVPVPPALLSALKEWRQAEPDGVYVCPAPRDAKAPITAEAIEKFYRNALELAGRHSPHSWRSAFSTISREHAKDGDVIEAQLDHVVGNKIASAYDRAKRLDLRRALMTWYESALVAARDGAKVLPLAKKA